MADNYNQIYPNPQRQESFTRAVLEDFNPAKPGSTLFNLTVGSMATTYLTAGPWNQLAAGKGLPWTGIYGLRDIAAGQKAYNNVWRVSKHNIPSRAIEAVIRGFSPTKADQYAKAGLFARGGLFNPSNVGKEKAVFGLFRMSAVGRFIGGTGEHWKYPGVMAKSVPVDIENLIRLENKWTKQEFQQFMRMGRGKEVVRSYQEALNIVKGSRKDAFLGLFGKGRGMKSVEEIIKTTSPRSGGVVYSTTAGTERALKQGVARMGKLRTAATLGRGLSIAMWAPVVFQLASIGFGGVTNLMGEAGRRAEDLFERLGPNRRMEMGGGVTGGFITSASATERQRSLQAIKQTGMQARGMLGNEAALQHRI